MRFKSRYLALIISFAALYAVLSLVPLSPIIGAVGAFITLASFMAPLIGIILGPYLGTVAVSIGGFLGWSIMQTGAFSFISFLPGSTAALASGLLNSGKRVYVLILYSALFLLLAFYPTIGPVWLFPVYVWFQLIGLIILTSPLTHTAVAFVNKDNNVARLTAGIAIISLSSTLIGQMTGNLMFELIYYPRIFPQIESWRIGQWQALTFLYPAERLVITVLAAIIGTPVIRAIRAYGFEMGGR